MDKFIIAMFFVSIMSACNFEDVKFENLEIRGSIYFYNDAPFTGEVLTHFDTGDVSGKITFLNGIPSGRWESLGYDGDMIQFGTYKVSDLLRQFKSLEIDRINICEINEGTLRLNKVFIISKNCGSLSKADSLELNQKLLNVLRSQNSKAIKIDDIICRDREI